MVELDTLLKQAGDLQTLPEIYIRVTELLEDENSTAYQIGNTVQTDPVLTAKVLRLINSAYYGLPNPVSSIAQSVTLLGRQQLQQVLMGSVLVGVLKDFEISEFPLRDFWQHSFKTAIISRHLGMQNVHILDHEALFTAGLLHDMGWLIIAKVVPSAFTNITQLAVARQVDTLVIEAEKLGVTHVDVGVALMQQWAIPSTITQCVKNHHDSEYEGPFSVETSIIALANKLSHHVLTADDHEVEVMLNQIPNWQKTKCSAEQIMIAIRLADEQWYEVMDSLGMSDLEIIDDGDEEFEFNTHQGRFS
ncbi:MAG: HD-like signal output (HDOD) protein [Gammaproteobacteria bacterium]|jgi:HD-like signal output (HDOD) protein